MSEANNILDRLEPRKAALLDSHLSMVIEANKKLNLTRIDDKEQGILLHIEDSLSALPEVNDAIPGLLGDIGTGGGFPGIPLAIMTGRETVLIDSSKKKINVLKEIIDTIGMTAQISTCALRIEEASLDYRSSFSVVTARALSSLASLMELASPLLCNNGRLVCYKANVGEDEIAHTIKIEKILGMRLVSERVLQLSDGATNRRIIVYEKVGSPEKQLPRKIGLAQKRPF